MFIRGNEIEKLLTKLCERRGLHRNEIQFFLAAVEFRFLVMKLCVFRSGKLAIKLTVCSCSWQFILYCLNEKWRDLLRSRNTHSVNTLNIFC